jgi:hypothetical protein
VQRRWRVPASFFGSASWRSKGSIRRLKDAWLAGGRRFGCSVSTMMTSSSPDPGGVGGWFRGGAASFGSALCRLSVPFLSLCCSCCCLACASCLVLGGCTAGGGTTPRSLSMSSSKAILFDKEDMYAFEIGLSLIRLASSALDGRAGTYRLLSSSSLMMHVAPVLLH